MLLLSFTTVMKPVTVFHVFCVIERTPIMSQCIVYIMKLYSSLCVHKAMQISRRNALPFSDLDPLGEKKDMDL